MKKTSAPPASHRLRGERGAALPTALLVLVALTSLTIVFASLASTESAVSRNHMLAAQARALAESGIERALWALANPADASGIPATMGTSAGAPYDGGTSFTLASLGSFTVNVARPVGGTPTNERIVTAIGRASGTGTAARKIQATLMQISWAQVNPPCALCVKGNLDVSGNAAIDAYPGHAGVSFCAGSTPQGGSVTTGTTSQGGSSSIWGPGNDVANESADMPQGEGLSVPAMTWEELSLLRNLARAAGTYYQGPTSFNNSQPLPPQGGIVFVDTTTGADLSAGPPVSPLTSEMGNVTITGNQTWSGWLIAIGDITVSGTVYITGSLYARNDFVFNGNGEIHGSVTAENTQGTVQSSVDASAGGSSKIIYNCQAAKDGGGTISDGWFVKPGTFTEASGT